MSNSDYKRDDRLRNDFAPKADVKEEIERLLKLKKQKEAELDVLVTGLRKLLNK